MIRSKLRKFFLERVGNKEILEIIDSEELTLIERFLSAEDQEFREYLASELMERTLQNIEPDFPLFWRLFGIESHKLASMEKGAVFIKEDYRSHYVHSVYVYLTGFYLLQKNLLGEKFLNCLNLRYFDTHHKERPVYDTYVYSGADERKEFQIRWALTAFFHDIAYLSEFNLKVMQREGERLTGQKHPYSIQINDLQFFLSVPFLSTIKEKTRLSIAPGYLFSEDILDIISHRLVNRIGNFSRNLIYVSLKEWIINGLEKGWFDHGLMGAIFLLQQFYSSLHNFFFDGLNDIGREDIQYSLKIPINRSIIRFTDAMTAIALHNVKHFNTGIFKSALKVKIINHKLPLAFLLILSDELQTWERDLSLLPRVHPAMDAVRALRKYRINKNLFINHYNSLYSEYASLKFEENRLTFVLPFWKDKKESDDNEEINFIIERKSNKGEEGIFAHKTEILFKKKSLPLLHLFMKKFPEKSGQYKIMKKIYQETEVEAWDKFKGENKTLAQFIELAFAIKRLLEISGSNEIRQDNNNVRVQLLECLLTDVLPIIKLLRKGQDILFPYMKPYHFHDIKEREEGKDSSDSKDNKDQLEDCTLLLHYPGEEVEEIGKVIKDRIERKLDPRKKMDVKLKYPEVSRVGLNRLIKEYISSLEKILLSLQYGDITITRIPGRNS